VLFELLLDPSTISPKGIVRFRSCNKAVANVFLHKGGASQRGRNRTLPFGLIVLSVRKVLSGSRRARRPSLMEKYIGHRLVARSELNNTFWTDSTYWRIFKTFETACTSSCVFLSTTVNFHLAYWLLFCDTLPSPLRSKNPCLGYETKYTRVDTYWPETWENDGSFLDLSSLLIVI